MSPVREYREPAFDQASACPGVWALTANVLAGVRILVAEDSPDTQRLILSILHRTGADVEIVENGRLAVNKATETSFDLILMDIQMPEMDGYQATRMLCEQGVSVPIVALTAHAMRGDREKCLAAGCVDYVTKPIHIRQLIGTIMQHTGRGEGNGLEALCRHGHHSRQTVRSEFDDDPGLETVIAEYTAALPGHVDAMRRAADQGDHNQLQRLAHQLKGTGGSYGYPALSDLGKRLEDAAQASDTEGVALVLKELAELAQFLVAERRTSATSTGSTTSATSTGSGQASSGQASSQQASSRLRPGSGGQAGQADSVGPRHHSPERTDQ